MKYVYIIDFYVLTGMALPRPTRGEIVYLRDRYDFELFCDPVYLVCVL